MLIVSCQADSDSPFNKPEYISLFAKCAESCGASAVRIEGINNLKDVSSKVQIPIIGLVKDHYPDGTVRISRNESDIKEILKYTDTVAIDGTSREGGPEFIKYIKNKYNCNIVADVLMLWKLLNVQIIPTISLLLYLGILLGKQLQKNLIIV